MFTDTPSILVVDHEPEFAKTLATFLTRIGCEPTLAVDGADCLHRLSEQRPPAVVISGVKIQGVDGLRIYQKTRELYRNAVGVILCTADPDFVRKTIPDLLEQCFVGSRNTPSQLPVDPCNNVWVFEKPILDLSLLQAAILQQTARGALLQN